jgi:hypothetical protein
MATATTSSSGNTSPVNGAQVKRTQQDAEFGTLHQNAIGDKAKRRHFFSPLDLSWAEAVHKDAEDVQYTPEEEVSRCWNFGVAFVLMGCLEECS